MDPADQQMRLGLVGGEEHRALQLSERLAILFGLVALVVGAFLVANTMAMTVGERVREIAPFLAIIPFDDAAMARTMIKPLVSFYIGGMGAKDKNFYGEYIRRIGFVAEPDGWMNLMRLGPDDRLERGTAPIEAEFAFPDWVFALADYAMRSMAILGLSVPGFWIATLCVLLPAIWWGWTPHLGFTEFSKSPGAHVLQFILPALILGIASAAGIMRLTRAMLLEVLRQDYLTTARAKGLNEQVVIGRHALKNALIPVVTIIAVTMPRVVGGSTVVETVFAYPGMGRLLYTSIMGNDYVVAMTVVMIIAVTVIFFNLLADILYGWLDPRIRYQN